MQTLPSSRLKDWSSARQNKIVAPLEDGSVCIWDLNHSHSANSSRAVRPMIKIWARGEQYTPNTSPHAPPQPTSPIERARAAAEWDSSAEGEHVDWYSEYIARHGPISFSPSADESHSAAALALSLQDNSPVSSESPFTGGTEGTLMIPGNYLGVRGRGRLRNGTRRLRGSMWTGIRRVPFRSRPRPLTPR
jgi:hypothetical protein